MAKQVGTTYGDALFSLAEQDDKIDALYEEIREVDRIFCENEELVRFLHHPKVIKEEKIAFIEKVFSGRVSDDVLGFLNVIIRKDRYGQIHDIFDHFIHRVKEYKGIGVAYVDSAAALSPDQKKRLTDKLLETTKYTTFEMHYREDPALLGGLVIRVGDRVLDSSLKTQLGKLSKKLSAIRVS